jgi:hypothetical protein
VCVCGLQSFVIPERGADIPPPLPPQRGFQVMRIFRGGGGGVRKQENSRNIWASLLGSGVGCTTVPAVSILYNGAAEGISSRDLT